MPRVVETGEKFQLSVEKCIGYGELRYGFSEEEVSNAEYMPVQESFEIDPGSLSGDQTLYVQFRVNSGEQEGMESPLLYKGMKLGVLEEGRLLPFDMQSAGAYDKDGFGSRSNPYDGVFDLATDEWSDGSNGKTGTSNYIADGTGGLEGKYDQDKDSKIVTEEGIEYQLSTGIYTDGTPNVATGNGTVVPVPAKGEYEKIYVLAAGKDNNVPGTFTMNYTDGTSDKQEIIANYWAGTDSPEEIVFDGIDACLGWWNNEIWAMGVMRQYELEPDPEKVLESVTLPKTSNLIRIFAMTGKEADKLAEDAQAYEASADKTTYTEGAVTDSDEQSDPTYEEFIELYGDDPKGRQSDKRAGEKMLPGRLAAQRA